MPQEPDQPSAHPWQAIAQQMMRENDPAKLQSLAKKLNEAMLTEERERVRRRLGLSALIRNR